MKYKNISYSIKVDFHCKMWAVWWIVSEYIVYCKCTWNWESTPVLDSSIPSILWSHSLFPCWILLQDYKGNIHDWIIHIREDQNENLLLFPILVFAHLVQSTQQPINGSFIICLETITSTLMLENLAIFCVCGNLITRNIICEGVYRQHNMI